VRRAGKVRRAKARKEKQQLIPAAPCSVSSTTTDDGPRLSDREEQRAYVREPHALDTETATLWNVSFRCRSPVTINPPSEIFGEKGES
jgi:hypothetical protein